MTPRPLFVSLLIATAALAPVATPPAVAAPDASPVDGKEAIKLYKRGRQLVAQRKYEEALSVLDEALALLPSPNTELLKAQALRELGRLGEAMAAYQRVKQEASRRVSKGEQRYQRTLAEAGRWSAVLSAKVGELVVVVNHAPAGTTLTVGGDAVATDGDRATQILAARLWREPGAVTVVARSDDGREVTQEATIATTASATVTLVFPEPVGPPVVATDPEPLPNEEDTPFPMPPWPSYAALGVGALGFGVFGVFGALSSSTASDLDECTPSCPDSMRDDADTAQTDQTVANVGLIVGITGVTAAAAIWLVTGLTVEPSDEPDEVTLHVGPGGLGVSGTF